MGGAERRPVPIAQAVDSLPPGKTTVLSEEFLRQAACGKGERAGHEAVQRDVDRRA